WGSRNGRPRRPLPPGKKRTSLRTSFAPSGSILRLRNERVNGVQPAPVVPTEAAPIPRIQANDLRGNRTVTKNDTAPSCKVAAPAPLKHTPRFRRRALTNGFCDAASGLVA